MTPEEFKAARLEVAGTIQRMAHICGIHRQTWVKWERGESNPSGTAVQLVWLVLYLHRTGRLDECLRTIGESHD